MSSQSSFFIRHKGWIIFVAILVALSWKIFVRDGEVFRTIHGHLPGSCEVIRGVVGPEDLFLIPDRGFLLSSDVRAPIQYTTTKNGGLYFYDFRHKDRLPINLTEKLSIEFRPHGIDAWQVSETEWRVFAVNHRVRHDTVEILKLTFPNNEPLIEYVRSVEDENLLINTNDLLALGPEEFMSTQDHAFQGNFGKMFEDVTGLGLGFITYFDGKMFHKIYDSISMPNGIARVPNTPDIYVSAMIGKKILHMRWLPDQKVLLMVDQIKIPGAPDNLVYDSRDDSLWIGAHPKLLALKFHSEDPKNKIAPAMVLKISNLSSNPRVEEILLDDGSLISAASVALPVNSHVYVGSIYDEKFLDCLIQRDEHLTKP